ncbi:MAG: VPLPA-CTERM sorting domain-containing protein [Rhodobacteraceae bacterium]|nr:VPLPA-CTERM sorting domain-containing protein [Paracoccaceae bacterium]MCF8514092.1 VPLPA-CTERM sorting domain-containing protein [Paracoccaceae bacterium]MCF8518336.1 VPLPA-CTERM sorting domain-containing protein [Paracoccaceae bacterium]
MRIEGRFTAFCAVIALGASLAAPADAATMLVTDDSGYTGPSLDLGPFVTGAYNFTFGPTALPGGITFTASPGGGGNSGLGSVIGQGSYGLGSNGNFGGDAVYIGVDSGTGFAQLTFSSLISSFGGYWNYAPANGGDNAFIEALDILGVSLGFYDLEVLAPISTPGGFNEFAFRGISSDAADIKSIRFGGNYILLAGTPDGSVVTPSEVPVPASLPLLVGGVMLLAGLRRKRKAKMV